MSLYGEWKEATIASGASSSSAVDLGRDYDWLSLEIPEMTTSQLYLQVAEALASTYYDLGRDTTTVEESFNHADVWQIGGWRYIKIISTAVQGAQRLIRVRGMRY